MGRAAKRREISKLLKKLGIPSKLYRGNKFRFFSRYPAHAMFDLLAKLKLAAPGTLVNDCDSFNHVVKGFRKGAFQHKQRVWRTWGRDRKINGYYLDLPQFEFEDGEWSCGCNASPMEPETREQIEKHMLRYYNQDATLSDMLNPNKPSMKRWDALRNEKHITDERGIVLPEYRE